MGYFVSFAFIGGVWIAHSTLTRFIKVADPDLLRLNLMLLLSVSFLPFTTAIAATHLFASNLTFHEVTVSTSTERVAAVVFGLNLALAALMIYLMLRTPDARRMSQPMTWPRKNCGPSPENGGQQCCFRPARPLSASSCR